MKEKRNTINRRDFLKTAGAAGLGTALVSTGTMAGANEPLAAAEPKESESSQMPKRTLGKTGVKVSCLGLGTMFNLVDNQIVLRSTLKNGVTFWDTSHTYAGGNSELGIGKFLSKNPQARKNIFLVSKASSARNVGQFEERLQLSLKRLNTDYIDLYYAPHGADDPAQLSDELRRWAESAKKRKLIKFFGFSTHSNMAKCLAAAARLGWIDALMPRFNFRVMQDPEMQAAIDACHKAKIGIVAMKTTGRTTIKRFKKKFETEAEKKMVAHFLKRGFSPEQAAIKLVLADERITAAPVQMENTKIIAQNVAAVLDKTEVTQADREVFREYAAATCTGYCAGCAEICDAALPGLPYTSDVMRYLMYYNSYGDRERARELFAEIPAEARNRLLSVDYSEAEARCPQRMPIGELVAEAVGKLA